jgi:DHA3 family macrolide efflux protein-like MFS transporter
MNDSTLPEAHSSWQKNIALFLGGQGLSLFGSMLVNYAIMWHVTLQTGSGSMMTLFTIAAVLPMFFISPFGGVWADRYNRKYLINLADSAIALVTLALAILFFMGYDHIGWLFICAAARSAGQGVQLPAVNALIPQLVPEASLTKISGINSSVQSLCMFASPMLAGVLLTAAPLEALFFIDVITAAIGISIVFFLVRVPERDADKSGKKAPADYFQDIKAGVAYIRQRDFIKQFMLIALTFNVMVAPAAVMTPLQATRNFGADVWRLTAIEIAFSSGMMLGGILLGLWGGFKNRVYSMTAGTILFGLTTIGLGLLDNFGLYLACMAADGMTMPLFNTPLTAILQSKVDTDYMGRVFSVLAMVSSVMMPLGMVIFGPLGDVVTIDFLLIVTGAGIVVLGLMIASSKTLREVGKPT